MAGLVAIVDDDFFVETRNLVSIILIAVSFAVIWALTAHGEDITQV